MPVRHVSMAIAGLSLLVALNAAHTQTVTERISGASYVNFGKDKTGLNSYTSAGIMCVVHNPSCGGVGHNGKDHYFSANLPAGAQLIRVDYKAFWPNGINHTDRGGWGSSGSYGEDESQQSSAPLVTVHWQNACESPWPPSGKNWSGLDATYQISFIVSHPANVVLKDHGVDANSPFLDVCAKGDQPVGNASTTAASPAPLAVYLATQGTWFASSFGGLGASGKLLTIQNGEDFVLEIIADQNMPGGCGKAGNKDLTAHQSIPASQIYGSNAAYPKVIGACAPSSLTIGRQSVGIVLTYQPN